MAWTDVKIELDKVKTAVDSLSTADGLTAKVDTLERVDATAIMAECTLLSVKLANIKDRAKEEQKPTLEEASVAVLADIRKQADIKVNTTKDIFGIITSEVFSSVKLGKKVTRSRSFTDTTIRKRCTSKTHKTEAL